jgi:acyl-CoA thioesterase-2
VVILASLELSSLGDDVFSTGTPIEGDHVFGGLVVAHALRAAASTVDSGRAPASLHASFVVAGRGGEPLRYEVERTRDGSSFTTRRVVARQSHGVVLVLTADFATDEDGLEYAAAPLGSVPDVGGLPPSRYDSPMFEARDAPPTGAPPHARVQWFRSRDALGDDPLVHRLALVLLTDLGATRAVREPHASMSDDARRLSVSLDHSIWFHRDGRLDDWVASEIAPVSTHAGRGLAIGTARSADGTLLATFAQEALLRVRR